MREDGNQGGWIYLWKRLVNSIELIKRAWDSVCSLNCPLSFDTFCWVVIIMFQAQLRDDYYTVWISLIPHSSSECLIPYCVDLCMDFPTITSGHICTDYLTFEELPDRAQSVRGYWGPGKFSCRSSWRTPNHKWHRASTADLMLIHAEARNISEALSGSL